MRPQELRWVQVRVGLFVALTLFVAFALLAALGIAGSPLERRAHVHGLFDDVSGIAVGSPVEMGGVIVGEVAEIDLPDLETGLVPVRLSIDFAAMHRLGPSSEAYTGSHALVGQRFIGLTWRAANEPPLKDGDRIQTSSGQSTEDLVDDARRTLAEGRKLIGELRQLSGALARAGKAIDAGDGSVGALLHDRELYDRLVSAARSADELVSDPALSRDLKEAAGAMARTTRRVEQGEGVLGRLTTEGEDARRLQRTLAHLESASAGLSQARGTLGSLINDKGLLVRLDALVGQLDSLFADVRRNPERYLNIKPF